MINVFVKEGFSDIWDPYLYDWGGADDHEFDIHTYEDLVDMYELRAGPIIFADIERLTDADRTLALDVLRVVAENRPDIPILNSPTETLRRYDLLTELHRKGLNPFRVYRLTDTMTPDRFPVFLRYENDHTGTTTGLLHSQEELDRAIVRAKIRQHDLRQLIIVEFVDTSDADGKYVKYAAFKVGGAIVARHAHTHTKWVVKSEGSSNTPDAVLLQFEYVRDNPHVSLLRMRFDIGAADYGRIDYSMLGDSLVTWEINTNPMIIWYRAQQAPLSEPRQEIFLSRLRAAFDAIEPDDLDQSRISLASVRSEFRLASWVQTRSRQAAAQRLGRKYKRFLEPAVRVVEIASVPFEKRILDRWKRRNVGRVQGVR